MKGNVTQKHLFKLLTRQIARGTIIVLPGPLSPLFSPLPRPVLTEFPADVLPIEHFAEVGPS